MLDPQFEDALQALLPGLISKQQVYGELRALERGDAEVEQDDVEIYHLNMDENVPQVVRVLLGIGTKRGRECALAVDVFFVREVVSPTPPERVRDARIAWRSWRQ